MNINFVLAEMTYLRYFIPLAIEAQKRQIQSNFFIGPPHGKYNCPHLKNNQQKLTQLSKEYNFKTYPIEKSKNHPGITFLIEGVWIKQLHDNHKKIVLTYMTDYRHLYSNYIDKCDNVIFPSESFATYYDTLSDKNLYLGSPKYDTALNRNECFESHNLNRDKKYALIIYPRYRDLHKFPIKEIIESILSRGITPIIKSRGKEPCRDKMGCLYFEDKDWFPHTTLSLLECSSLVINSGSTTIKEAIMKKRPVLNFNLKPHFHLSFLYDYAFVKNIDVGKFNQPMFKNLIESHLGQNFEKSFNQCISDHLFSRGSSKRILDKVL